MMNVPTEPGFYWARVAYTGGWIPVQMFQSPTGLYAFLFQRRDPAKLSMFSEWGEKIERNAYRKGFEDGQFDARFGGLEKPQAMDEAGSPLDFML